MQETVATFGLPFFLALAGVDVLLFLLLRWLLGKRLESQSAVLGLSMAGAVVLGLPVLLGLLKLWNSINS
jgi:hypothetical protein